MDKTHCYALAEHGLVLSFDAPILDDITLRRLFAFTEQLKRSGEFVDLVPAQSSLTLYLKEPSQQNTWLTRLPELWQEVEAASYQPKLHRLPVTYGGEAGPDLENVANTLNLTPKEVIELHTSLCFKVLFLGFLPGFGYLGHLPDSLKLPRMSTPRSKVPAGSVAIAESLTAIYPSESPGGWHILGRTEQSLFTPNSESPSLFQPGDQVQFTVKEIL